MPNASDTSILRGRTLNTHAQLTVTGDFTVPIPYAEFGILEFLGTVNTTFTISLPAIDGHLWVISNGTSGTGTMQVATTRLQGSVVIPQGGSAVCYSDGTNINGIGLAAGANGSAAGSGALLYAAANSAAFTLTQATTRYQVVTFITGGQATTITWPANDSAPGRFWVVSNTTLFNLTLKSATDSGAGVVLQPNETALIAIDSNGSMQRAGVSSTGSLPVSEGGTGATSLPAARENLGAQIIDQAGQYIVPDGAGPSTLGNAQMNPVTLTGGTVNATVILPTNYLLTGTGYRSTWFVNNQTLYTISLCSDVDTATLVAVATGTKAIIGLNQYGSLIAFD